MKSNSIWRNVRNTGRSSIIANNKFMPRLNILSLGLVSAKAYLGRMPYLDLANSGDTRFDNHFEEVFMEMR